MEVKVLVIFDNKSREFYLVNIPLTDSAMEQSNLKMEEALYNMGVIYKENLLDYQESISAFEELMSRYPAGRYAPSALYNLHDLYNDTQKPTRAEYYKAQLLAKYPESHYSKLLNNPNYIQELEEEEKKVVRVYEQVFAYYQDKQYGSVITGADSAIVQFQDDPLDSQIQVYQGPFRGSPGRKRGDESGTRFIDCPASRNRGEHPGPGDY